MPDIIHLLLAAGNSHRMGSPKQLLPWMDKTLIEHQIDVRLQTGYDVTVVLGGHSDKIIPVIEKLPITFFVNKNWESGMGTSIAHGIEMLERKYPESEGVLISLLDQPLVTKEHLEKLISSFKVNTKQIIVSESSSGWIGVPVLFDKTYYSELKTLTGDQGAKKIIKKHPNKVISIECGNLLLDMDNQDDYQKLKYKSKL